MTRIGRVPETGPGRGLAALPVSLTREQIIQHNGERLLSLIRKNRAYDIVTVKFWQDYLMRLSMADPELRTQLFKLVERVPEIHTVKDLKAIRAELFEGLNIPMPRLVRFGLYTLPATMFYPAYKASVHLMADRFIAGANMEEALPNIRRLQRLGLGITLDILGESVKNSQEAIANIVKYTNNIRYLSDELGLGSAAGVNLSIKLTGISHDVSLANIEGVKDHLRIVFRAIKEAGAFLRIDMEQYAIKDLTFRIFMELLSEPEFYNYEDIGIVVQAYLKEAEQDADRLIEWARVRFEQTGARTAIRLVKGAYNEKEAVWAAQGGYPNPICDSKPATDANFEKIAEKFIANHKYFKLAFGSHNVRSYAVIMTLADEYGAGPEEIEMQLLYGMGEPLLLAALQLGYQGRIYTPVGDLEKGLAYLVRRLLENSSKTSMLVNLSEFLAGRMTKKQLLAPPLA